MLAESGLRGETRWSSSCLFLCETLHERGLLAGLLCRYILRRHPETPVISVKVAGSQGPHKVTRDMAAALHVAAKRWLGQSPFNDLNLDDLSTFDLKMLLAEAIKELNQNFQGRNGPWFVLEISDVTTEDATLSALNLLRSLISEGTNISWTVFAPKVILDIVDLSGVSPFYNIFSVRDPKTKFVTIPSPYICGMPITSREQLFGRTQMLADIQQSIIQGSRPVALWGLRRIGKTSVLLALRDLLSTSYLPVFVDMERFDARKPNLLYFALARSLKEKAREFSESESLTWSDRGIAFEELMGIVSRVEQRAGRRVLYLLDEIDTFRAQQLMLVTLGKLTRAGLVGCIVGTVQVKEWLSDPTSPIFDLFMEQKLGCLERGAAIELIVRPVENMVSYETEAVNEILKLMGTNPMLVQMLCDSVMNILNIEGSTRVTDKTVHRAYREFTQSPHSVFEYLSEILDPLCLHLLGTFATNRAEPTGIRRDELLEYVVKNGKTVENIDLHDRVQKAIGALCDAEILELCDDQYCLKGQCYLDILVPMSAR